MRTLSHLNSFGDTIVEVLIAIAILSAVLAGAYTSANRSFNNSRQSQERGEAIKVAETQLEKIKAFASNPAVYNTATYCFDATNNIKLFTDPTYVSGATLDAENFSAYPAECKFFDFYNAAIKYTPPSPGSPPPLDDYFTIKVRWDRFGGQRDEIVMFYRLHQ